MTVSTSKTGETHNRSIVHAMAMFQLPLILCSKVLILKEDIEKGEAICHLRHALPKEKKPEPELLAKRMVPFTNPAP